MTMTYTEQLLRTIEEVEAAIKQRKSDEYIRYAYEGHGYDVADRTQRMALVERVADEYVKAHAEVNQAALERWAERGGKGQRPSPIPLDAALLERLADAVLDEELTDPNPYKVAHNEYPFMSDWQLELRRDRETGLKAAEETGTDGRNYAAPKRRRRTGYENNFVDRNAKIRNAERAAQYKRDTAAGPVTVSYVT